MKSTLKYALGAALGMVAVVPAMAQDNFPDVPENHWVYENLGELKREGLLVGYPDGLYRGARPASRYELAAAIHAVWKRLKGITDGLDARVKALEEQIGGADNGDMKGLRDQLAAMQADLNRMKSWGDDLDGLKKMMEEFRAELKQMGVDVDQVKKDIADLQDRVKALEARKPAVDIHGDATLLVLNGHGDDNNFGVTPGFRLTGVRRGQRAGQPGGSMVQDFTVLHEAAFQFKSTNDEGPKWQATLVTGNLFGAGALGDQTQDQYLAGFSEPSQDVYFQDFFVDIDTSVMGVGFQAIVGRQGYQISPYMLKRVDDTTFFKNDRWDNGDWMFDGALLKFKFGGVNLHTWAGRNSARNSVNGVPIQQMFNPQTGAVIDQSLGVRLNIPITDMGSVDLAYMWLDSNFVGANGDRVNVFGGDLNLKFADKIKFNGGYVKTPFTQGTSSRLDQDNAAWHGSLAYEGANFGVGAGYRRVEQNFGAPGWWGRIGSFWNPVNIEGFNANAYFNVSPEFTLWGKAEFAREVNDLVNLGSKDKLNTFTIGLKYAMKNGWNFMASYEDANFEAPGADAQERWYTFGFGYDLSKQANFRITYQASDVKNATNSGYTGLPAARYRGGLLSTQFTFKF